MEESWSAKGTGYFYLEFEGEKLTGKWISPGEKWYKVGLEPVDRNISDIHELDWKEYKKGATNSFTGTYITGYHFINDMWWEDDKPQLEVGFNGGYAILNQISEDTLAFDVMTISGPTYHFAVTSGLAIKTDDNTYVCNQTEYGPCIITITLSDYKVDVRADGSSMDCGFGARAYLDDSFVKACDKADFDTESEEGVIRMAQIESLRQINPWPPKEK